MSPRLIACPCLALLAALWGPSAAPALADDGDPVVHPGEPIDPSLYGDAVIEDMATAIERDAARPDEPVFKGADTHGTWVVPSRRSTCRPHSGVHNIVNRAGDTRMGIGFPTVTDMQGVWVAGQAGAGVWAKAIRAIGFLEGREVGTTPWFDEIEESPVWFPIDLAGVDRIVIEARAAWGGGGWYALDDLAFTPRRDEGPAEPVVIDFEDCDFRQMLTGTPYRGLTWEQGTGDFHRYDEGVDAPITLPEPAVEAPDEPATDAGGSGGIAGSATAPILLGDFQGVIRGDAGSFSFPPDTCGAIGPDHFVEVVNRNFAVYDKQTGAELVNMLLGSFLPDSNGDPRVLYDQHSGRWVVIVTDFDATIYLAVSLSDDATGAWFKTSFVVSTGSDAGCFPDYPTLGVDADGIYVTAFMAGCGMSIFALDKAPLIDPAPSLGTITAFRNLPFEGAVQPVHTYGTAAGEHFISRAGATTLRIRRLDGPLTSPTLLELGFVGVPFHEPAADVPALGSVTPLDSVDARLFNAVLRDGAIWTAHHVDVGGRAACRWYQVGVQPVALLQSGTISSPFQHYFMPSITVNAQGDAIIGFTGSSDLIYPAALFAGRAAGDPPGVMSSPATLQGGSGAQNNVDHFGRNRWGDYSLCSVDPDDDLTMWTIQEYGHDVDIWGTWIGELDVITVPLNDDCAAAIVLAGAEPFSTIDATTDGFPEPGLCGPLGGDDVGSDIWFSHVADCDGDLVVDLSGLDYSARLSIHDGACPTGPGEAIACLEASVQGSVSVPATDGQSFLIRVGGQGGAQGSGAVSAGCVPACAADCAGGGDGSVDVVDLLEMLAAWGAAGGSTCDIAPPGGDGAIDITDLLALLATWGPCS